MNEERQERCGDGCFHFTVLSKAKKQKIEKRKKSLSLSFSFLSLHAPFSRYRADFISSTPLSTSAIEAENFRAARAPSSEGKGSQAKKRGGGS